MTTNHQPTPYAWDEFRLKWAREEVTPEQAIGQLIVWGQQHEERLQALIRVQEGLANTLADHDTRLQDVAGRFPPEPR